MTLHLEEVECRMPRYGFNTIKARSIQSKLHARSDECVRQAQKEDSNMKPILEL